MARRTPECAGRSAQEIEKIKKGIIEIASWPIVSSTFRAGLTKLYTSKEYTIAMNDFDEFCVELSVMQPASTKAPSPKLKAPEKFQAPNLNLQTGRPETLAFCCLGFRVSLEL